MLGSKCAIELVIRAHHRPGFSLFNSLFKGRQVNFTQGTFIHFGADTEALEFLIIGSIMLE